MNHTRMPAEATPQSGAPAGAGTQSRAKRRHARAEAMRWQRLLAPYARPSRGRAMLDLATSVGPYLGLTAAMYVALQVSFCSRSRSRSPRPAADAHLHRLPRLLPRLVPALEARERVARDASSACSVHALRALAARPRRAPRELRGPRPARRRRRPTLTVAEYRARSWRGRLGYRLLRNPFVMFGLGPISRCSSARGSSPRACVRGCGAACSRPRRPRRDHRRALLARRLGGSCSSWARRRCCRARPGSGCSTCSTSSRTPTGSAARGGATPTPPCRAARYLRLRSPCSSSPATSACTTSTT